MAYSSYATVRRGTQHHLMRGVPQPHWRLAIVGCALSCVVGSGPAGAEIRPAGPVVTDDGAYTASTTQLHAAWTIDPSVSPREYRYQIRRGTPRQGTLIVSWTSTGQATSVTHGNLVLEPHTTYYFGVRARDRSGRWTSVGYSDGITVNRPPVVEAAGDAVAEGGATVHLDGSRTVDPDGDALQYAWRQTAGPSVLLASLSAPVTSFTAPFTRHDTALGFELAVSDGVYTETGASAVTVQQVAPPTVSIAVDDAVVSAGQPFTLTVTGTSPGGLAAVWWWGENTGITSATVTLTYPASPTSPQAFTTPVVNPTKLDRAFGSPLFSAAQAVTSYTFTSQVVITQAGTYQFGANSRDVFYAIAGEAHQASEGMGIPYVTVTVASDTQAPQLGPVGVSDVTTTSAIITWTTDEPSTSQVDYGTTAGYGQTTPLDPTLVTSHNVTLTGLSGLTTYHMRVRSADAVGNVAQSGDTMFQTASPGPSLVSVSGRQLIVQRRNADGTLAPPVPYVIRAVDWSPAGVSTNTTPSDPNNASVRRLEFGTWYQTDLPMIEAMQVNTIRTFIDFGVDASLGPVGRAILDDCYHRGIMVIMTVDDAINNTARAQQVVDYYKDHPAVLMWSLGSEWNINRYFGVASSVQDAAQRTQTAAQMVKSRDADHPVATSYGEIDINQTGLRLADTQNYVNNVCTSVDVWGLNIYRPTGFSFRSLFGQWASIAGKPMYLGEFGADAYDVRISGLNETAQGDWDRALWDDIHRNLSANDSGKVALGGAVFEWNDEWWKVSPPGSQQTGGWVSSGFPDGVGNEEYFGIVTIERMIRAVYNTLTTVFDSSYVPPPVTVLLRAVSEGYDVPGFPEGLAAFYRDGVGFYSKTGGGGGGRGFNVAVIDAATGDILNAGQNFDTYITRSTGTAMTNFVNYLSSIPNGRVVMVAVGDEAGLNFDNSCTRFSHPWVESGLQALESLGSAQIRSYCFRDSWAMIAVKGEGVARAEQRGDQVQVSAETAVTLP